MTFLRFSHRPTRAEKASAVLEAYAGRDFAGENLRVYQLEMPEVNRSLDIVFEADFPHAIVGWLEKSRSGFGPGAKELTTKAVRTHHKRLDYWNHNRVADEGLRKELGLD